MKQSKLTRLEWVGKSLNSFGYKIAVGVAVALIACCATSLVEAQTNFSSPQVISGEWGAVTNNNSSVTADSGFPGIAGNFPNAPLWYKWTAPHDGEVQLDTVGSQVWATNTIFVRLTNGLTAISNVIGYAKMDTVLGVYSGNNVARLTQIAANDDMFPLYQANWSSGQNILSLDVSNAPTVVFAPSFSGSSSWQPATVEGVQNSYYQPYWGPSKINFNAKAGTTYYFAVDTKQSAYSFFANPLYGPVILNWAYHSSGVFRFASENIDQTGVSDTNGNAMLLYTAAETETSRRWQGTVDATKYATTMRTYYTYNVPGVLVTITRSAGSSGRVLVSYTTVDGNTNMLANGDLPAKAGVDYMAVSGTLVFNDYEMSKSVLIPIIDNQPPTPIYRKNRDFTVAITSVVQDSLESSDVSTPRVDPIYYQALVRILDADIDPKGPSSTDVVNTNVTPNVTNTFYTLIPTNGVFNFQKTCYRVTRDGNTPGGSGSNGIPITVYVTRTGTNTASETVHWAVNSYFLDKSDASLNKNIFFPLQPASDYATPDPASSGGPLGITPDFGFSAYSGTITFPGGNNVDPQPISFTVYDNGSNQFNEDLQLNLYGLDSKNNPYQEGMIAQCTVTILFDDQHPPAGSVDENFNPDYGLSMVPPINTTPQNLAHPGTDPYGLGDVYSLAVLPNGKSIIVGDFSSYNGIGRNCMALLQTNGALDASFAPNSGANNFINQVAIVTTANTNRFLIAGNFTSFNGSPSPRIARVNLNGSLDGTFTPGAGADGTIWAMTVQSDGKILIGGDFTSFNGTNRMFLARLNTNGTVDATFNCTNINGTVNALAIQGTNIYVGGEFSVAGQVYREVARLNTNGVLDVSFNPGVGPNGTVYAMAAQTNGQLILGGAFTSVNGSSLNSLARLNVDGSVDTTNFFVGTGADDIIYTVTPQLDGTIYIGGAFTSFNGTRRLGFARLYSDGTLDTAFMDMAYNQFAGLPKIYFGDPNGVVYACGVQADGNIMIGGSFDQVGGGQFSSLVSSNTVPAYNNGIYYPSYDANQWPEPKSRDGIRNRSNVARLIGGSSSSAPGNVMLVPDSPTGFSANKSQQYKYISLVRTNGSLGPLGVNFVANNGLANNGVDFSYNSLDPFFWIYWEYIVLPGSRMHSDGLYGQNGYVSTDFGEFWSGGVVDNSLVLLNIVNNTSNSGDLSAAFQLSNPVQSDNFYLGGQTIPLGAALGRSSAPFTIIDDNKQSGTFGFISDTYIATNANNAINVVRSNGVYGTVSMRCWTSDGTATNGVDYNAVNNFQINFLPGVTGNNNFNVSIINNGYIYTNPIEKTVNLRLTTLNSPGGNATFGITNAVLRVINPNYQGYVTLGATNYSGTISSGHLDFVVKRTSGSKGAVTVQYATSNGTATNGVDYSGATNTLSWVDGDVSPRTISIPLINNQIVGANKQFFAKLSNPTLNGVPTPSMFGFYTNATLTISNDNSYGTLQLAASSYIVNETAGYATITVVRTLGAGGTASVNFATTNASAVNGSNYRATNGTLTFVPGQLSASFNVPILNDGIQNPSPFYFNVNLSSATNATLGSPGSAQVQILDAQSYNRPPGSPDVAFDATTAMNGDIYALALQSNGQIVVGGAFTQVGTTPESRVARLNTDGSLDTTFLDSLSGVNGSIYTMANQSDDRIVIGGAFNFVNGISRNFIARLMTDGTLDTSFNPGSGANGNVNALAETFVNGVRKLYAGGAFTSFNSVSTGYFVRLNNTGTPDSSFSTGTGFDGVVYTIAVYPTNSIYAGKLLVGGNFTHYNGSAVSHLVRLNVDGSVDTTFNPGTSANDIVRTLAIQLDGRVVAGGNFTSFNGTSANHIVRLNTDGSVDTAFATAVGAGLDSVVDAIVLQPDNRIVVVGQFSLNNGILRNRITRLLPTGAVDTGISFGSGANGAINATLIQPDGMIVIGGGFTTFNGQAHDRIARIYGGSSISGSVVVPAGSALVQESTPNGVIDANENVSLLFAFRASAGANVSNLVATLVATNGITLPSPASQSYGALTVSGPSASRLFAFAVDPAYTNGQQITATFILQDGTNTLGTAGFTYALGISTNMFANTNIIYINDNTNASPYPSTIEVGGLAGAIVKATVVFTNLTHSWPSDIDAVLKSSTQQSSLIMANAGSSFALNGVTLKFDDGAASSLPQSSQIVSGSYKPTAYLPVSAFPAPAPAGPYATNLAVFNGSNPNGTWSLYVMDDSMLNYGAITNGWFLNLVTANPVGTAGDVALGMSVSPAVVGVSNSLNFILTVTNYGPSASSGIVVSNTLPASATFSSAVGTQGSSVQIGSQVVWTVGSLGTNAGAKLTITVKPTAIGSIYNSARVTASTTDPNPDDDFASVTVGVSTVSAPILSGSASSTNGVFKFTLTGTPGASYIVQASTNLVSWLPVYTNISPFTFTDTTASNSPSRFYRAVVGP
jgi:uncharacterized delta-60 repeat protein